MYVEPISDFGRLTYEAWRVGRLIVDTGIHHFKWTREEAIEFFQNCRVTTQFRCPRPFEYTLIDTVSKYASVLICPVFSWFCSVRP